jgi:DNA-binding PadR family transcriptional regulator
VAKGFQSGLYEVMFFMAMKNRPAYGYDLAERFRKMAGGHIKVSYGTIYPFLRRMERRGIIRSRRDELSGRVYYELTRRGREAQERLSKRIKESQKEWEERLLGILAMHAEVFGRKAFTELLKRAQF